MTTMALHVLMAPDGIHPERIEACGWGIDNVIRTRAEVLVRPSGWRVASLPQAVAERSGMDGDDVRCVLRIVGGLSKGTWTGLAATSSLIIVHGAEAADRGLTISRTMFGMDPTWRRTSTRIADTAVEAAKVLGLTDREPSLAEATERLLGKRMGGVEAIVALFNHADVARKWKEAA